MRYVVGFMMSAFLVGGAGLFVAGVYALIRRLAARGRLRSAEGEIVRIKKRMKVTDNEMRRSAEYHYPEIQFRPGQGPETKFVSEIGAGARAKRYAVGQKIGVLSDPEGAIPPMIDSWGGIWGPHLVRTVFGPVFVFGAALIWFAFGDKIMGR